MQWVTVEQKQMWSFWFRNHHFVDFPPKFEVQTAFIPIETNIQRLDIACMLQAHSFSSDYAQILFHFWQNDPNVLFFSQAFNISSNPK